MKSIESFSDNRTDIGIAILRIVTGVIFFAHGAQKLFQFGLEGVSGAFAGMGIPLPGITGPGIAAIEFLGGIVLVFGLFTRAAGSALAVAMLGAIVFVHAGGGFFAPGGFEYPLALFAASVALALLGPGLYSLDALLERRRVAISVLQTA